MVLLKRILILEDNLRVLSELLSSIAIIEDEQPFDLSVVVLTDHELVEEYVNANPRAKFDIILVDRDCKLNGSFHVLDIERLGVEKVIGISSIPEYNEELRKRGVRHVVEKDSRNMESFIGEVGILIWNMLDKMPKVENT